MMYAIKGNKDSQKQTFFLIIYDCTIINIHQFIIQLHLILENYYNSCHNKYIVYVTANIIIIIITNIYFI